MPVLPFELGLSIWLKEIKKKKMKHSEINKQEEKKKFTNLAFVK